MKLAPIETPEAITDPAGPNRRRLIASSVLGALWVTLPPLAGFWILFELADIAAFLRTDPVWGFWGYVAVFAITAGLGFLPTYSQAFLGGWVFGMQWGLIGAIMGFTGGAAIGYMIARMVTGDSVDQWLDANPKRKAIRDTLARGSFKHSFLIVTLIRLPPSSYQGTRVDLEAGGIADIRNRHLTFGRQRSQIDLIQEMNRDLLDKHPGNPELDGVIQSFELAYRMQTSVPAVLDLKAEKSSTLERYGINHEATQEFGTQCLMARRLAESGVRIIQVSKKGWDQHNNLKSALTENCLAVDQPIAALLQDLKERDMLKDTLVLWGGEFGRSPQDQANSGDGRRHNNSGYTMWMAGGGVKGGMRYGATDETGGTSVLGKIGTHDLHATILHLLGFDHTKLTYRYAGRDFRLTDVYGEVAKDILA